MRMTKVDSLSHTVSNQPIALYASPCWLQKRYCTALKISGGFDNGREDLTERLNSKKVSNNPEAINQKKNQINPF